MRVKSIMLVAMVCVMVDVASADIVRGIDIDFVTIGNAGNPGDTRTIYPNSANPYGCGEVSYEYQIGKYEITNGQWDAFVLMAGDPTGNPSEAYNNNPLTSWTGSNIPANGVSWYEATQFCNYLTSGDKSRGAYQFSGTNTNPGDFLGVDRDAAVATYETVYVIPTEDEWYKAAYYTGSGYSTYANGQDTIPAADNGWNYVGGTYSSPWNVGTGAMEQNGTFDMMGNVWEWNETLIGSNRGVRGGSYLNYVSDIRSSGQEDYYPIAETCAIGFRIASVPEPATLLLFGLGGFVLRKRNQHRKQKINRL